MDVCMYVMYRTWIEVWISRTMVARWGVMVTDLVGRSMILTVEVEIAAILSFSLTWDGSFGLGCEGFG